MRASELARMFELEDRYWWFVARRALVRALLARHLGKEATGRGDGGRRLTILDVGCGTGATLGLLAEFGRAMGLDRAPEALAYCRRRNQCRLALARAEELPVRDRAADVITALDLLEHLPDEDAATREFARALRPGGLLVVTVPALPWLWSEHDEALDHLRRYQASRLRAVLEQAGFTVLRLSPLIMLLLAPIAALRLVQRLLPRRRGGPRTAFIVPPRAINWLLTAVLRLENAWAVRWNLPVGVSLMAVARKPE